MTHRATRRSSQPITSHDLGRLADLAAEDAERLYERYPAWRGRCIAAALAQGAADHFAGRSGGLEDVDVWSLFVSMPGTRFPFGGQRKMHRDFGESHHGRQTYTDEERSDPKLAAKVRRWERFAGRRVDLMMRALKCEKDAPADEAVVQW